MFLHNLIVERKVKEFKFFFVIILVNTENDYSTEKKTIWKIYISENRSKLSCWIIFFSKYKLSMLWIVWFKLNKTKKIWSHLQTGRIYLFILLGSNKTKTKQRKLKIETIEINKSFWIEIYNLPGCFVVIIIIILIFGYILFLAIV